jgi:toxin ParE1/3/4
MYRVASNRTIDIVRILHDRTELRRHIPPAFDESTE